MVWVEVHTFEGKLGVTTFDIDSRGVGGTVLPTVRAAMLLSRVSGFRVRAYWRFEGMGRRRRHVGFLFCCPHCECLIVNQWRRSPFDLYPRPSSLKPSMPIVIDLW